MNNKHLSTTFLLLFFSLLIFGQEFRISGAVYDAGNGEALSFVNIVVNGGPEGGVSDIDGRFNLKSKEQVLTLTLSYVGYEPLVYEVNNAAKNHVLRMKRSEVMLDEVIIVPGENPAHRIVDSVLKYMPVNNPENLPSFRYTAHNKLSFGIGTEGMKPRDESDSADMAQVSGMMNKTYIMLIESITERKYLYPGKSRETVIASKVSGLSDPLFSLLASQLQTFSFYTDYLNILDKKFINPLSKGTTSRYLFILEDTLYSGVDTVFIMSYRPRRNRNFDALSGLVYINTSHYAVQYVTAEPAEGLTGSFGIKLRQQYELTDAGHWFPMQLNTELVYNYPQGMKLFGSGRSYIKDIEINGKITKRETGNIEFEIREDAGQKDDNFWDTHRFEPLSEKDMETYRIIDSLSKVHNFDRFTGLFKTLAEGKIPWKFVDIDLNRIVDFNNYNGWRAGIGLETNHKVSRVFAVGGYAAWSFKNETLRYGGHLRLNVPDNPDMSLTYSYVNDDTESAVSGVPVLKPSMSLNDFRSYLVSTTDYTRMHKVQLSARPQRYLQTAFSATVAEIAPNYAYSLAQKSGQFTLLSDMFGFTELGLHTRYAYKEKFMRSKGYNVSLGTAYPVVYFDFTKGLAGTGPGNFDYVKAEMALEKDFTVKMAGILSVRLFAGYVNGTLPYSRLFNARGSFTQFALYVPNSFNTMPLNAFLSDRYFSAFAVHNFGKLLFKTKVFQPEIAISQAYAIGSLSAHDVHRQINFNTLERGYHESGLIINDVIRTGFYGLGLGGFYRYGAYSTGRFLDDAALKVTFKLNI